MRGIDTGPRRVVVTADGRRSRVYEIAVDERERRVRAVLPPRE